MFQAVVASADILEEHTQGPAIGYSIVHVDHKHMLLWGCEGYEGHMDHGAGGQVKRSGNGLAEGLLQLLLLYWGCTMQLHLQVQDESGHNLTKPENMDVGTVSAAAGDQLCTKRRLQCNGSMISHAYITRQAWHGMRQVDARE